MDDRSRAEVEDTYAEAFRSIYAEVLVTARDRRWLDHAVAGAAAERPWGSLRRAGLSDDQGASFAFPLPRFVQ